MPSRSGFNSANNDLIFFTFFKNYFTGDLTFSKAKNVTARVSALVATLLGAVAPLRKSKIFPDLLCNTTSSTHKFVTG